MSTLTQLESEPRVGGVRVRVDGQPFATIAPGDVLALRLREGLQLSEPLRAGIEQRAEVFAARSAALRMLTARSLPGPELVRRLIGRGHPKPAVESAVAALIESGLIDNAAFARHYVRSRVRRRHGHNRLLADLRRMGVDDREAEAAIREVCETEGVDQVALLREAAERKARTLAGLDRDRRVRRLRSFLLRRGFPLAEVRVVVRELA